MTHRRLLAIASSGALVLGLALYGAQAKAQSEQGNAKSERHAGERAGRRGPMGPDRELQRLTQALNLTDDQQKQIRPILEDRQKQMQSLFSDDSLSRQDKMSKARTIREETQKKVRDVLTDDQRQKFDEHQKQMRERMERRRSGPDNKTEKTEKN